MCVCVCVCRGRPLPWWSSMRTQRRRDRPGACRRPCSSLPLSTSHWSPTTLRTTCTHRYCAGSLLLCSPHSVCVCVQLLQQQAVASGHASVSPVSPYQQPPPTFTMSGLLSPTSPTHPSPIPSVGGLGTSLASPGLPTLPSLTNGLPTLSPNGLGSSTDPLQSPLHRCVCVCVCVCVQ